MYRERLLDVGRGLGEAAPALAADLGEAGEVVGVDVSAEMLASRVAIRVDRQGTAGSRAALDAEHAGRMWRWLVRCGVTRV